MNKSLSMSLSFSPYSYAYYHSLLLLNLGLSQKNWKHHVLPVHYLSFLSKLSGGHLFSSQKYNLNPIILLYRALLYSTIYMYVNEQFQFHIKSPLFFLFSHRYLHCTENDNNNERKHVVEINKIFLELKVYGRG